MKAPFKFHGGKSRIADWISSFIPPHTIYVEPFFGAGNVFFKKPMVDHHLYQEVINDLESNVYMFFKVLRDHNELLSQKLLNTPYSREEKEKCWEYINKDRKEMIEWARSFYVVIVEGFGGAQNMSWGRSVGSNQAKRMKRDLSCFRDRLLNVNIENQDVLDVIDFWDTPSTCFYLDPPYPATDQRYNNQYSVEDYCKLCEKLKTIEGCFLMSNYENDFFDYPDDWMIERKETKSTMSQYKKDLKKIEVLYHTKMDIETWGKEDRKVYESGLLDVFKYDNPRSKRLREVALDILQKG